MSAINLAYFVCLAFAQKLEMLSRQPQTCILQTVLKQLQSLARLGVAMLLIGALSACAAVQSIGDVEHGFYVDNKGTEPIRAVVIHYGELYLPFCDPHCLPQRGGGGWNAPMRIQEEMRVTWQTADGQGHQARVPVRSKIKDLRRLSTLYLQFNGDQLTVVQALHYANPTILEFEKLQLYP